MAGHNKWSKIKHKKAVTDSAKSKVYSRYNKMIQIAIKNANGDPNATSVLNVINAAKAENVPKDNIERAIKKATSSDAQALTEVLYEGYGPAGVGMLIKAVTDNTNRTVTEVKTIFTKNGGSFASTGAVSWAFSKNQEGDWVPNEGTEIKLSEEDEEKLENLIELFQDNDDIVGVYVNAA
ncbi:YebC/PmpR family DNA-binding transcriptional regulator [Candidatus Campbellbacteria bacterium]|nr:MAG: YebC/PmpR family DNA-binding transcriptional regulator [Candidatus Campbellbacteria bacterium]